jgi:hypothetical protein
MSGEAGGPFQEGAHELANVGSWVSSPTAETETTNAATSHHEALFRDAADALSRAEAAEAAEGQLGDLQKKNAAVLKKELEKATASPPIFEEEDIPMKKATNQHLVTVIYCLLGSIDCIFRDCIFRDFITLVEKLRVEAAD